MVLTVNGGSSSIKFSLYSGGKALEKVMSGELSRIGQPDAILKFKNENGKAQQFKVTAADYASATDYLITLLEKEVDFKDIKAIGHRVVQGMKQTEPALITDKLLNELKKDIPYDPDHLPGEIRLIEAFRKHQPGTDQYACFDTAFHQTMPPVATLLPIPRRFERQGIRRYGFHGLSYQYLVQKLKKIAGKNVANGRVVLAHLGSGASLAAVYKGKSIDTSMGFTPAGGIPMSSRSGDVDPGVAWVMIKTEKLSPKQFNHLVNHESGLLGVSESSGDMSDLLANETTDPKAADAIALFCYYVKKQIGAYAAALGGLDTLVFSGGIGENSPLIRARICESLQFLGIDIDKKLNNKNKGRFSKGKIGVYMIPTDEELMIAQIVSKMINKKSNK